MKIKKFKFFESGSSIKYDDVIVDTGDDLETDELKKFDIIKKYFPYEHVSGIIDYEEGIVDLNFDNKFTIRGHYHEKTQTLPSILTYDQNEYDLNFHFFKSLSGIDIDKFEEEIKSLYNEIHTYTICIGDESYATSIVGTYTSKEEALKAYNDIGIYLVKGTQLEGKVIGKTVRSNDERGSEIIKLN